MQLSDTTMTAAGANKWGFGPIALLASAGLYLLLCVSLPNAPLMDMPNHLARSHIIADFLFDDGRVFGEKFALSFQFAPYLAGDLILASIDRLFGSEWAARIWIAASVGLLPWSVWFVLGVKGASRTTQVLGSLLALYLATDWFFVSGFLNYRISVACVLFAYGWFCRAESTGSTQAYVAYTLMLIAGYSMHLSALIFSAAAVGTTLCLHVLRGRQSIARAIVFLLPAIVLLGMHFSLADASGGQRFATDWGTVSSKLQRFASPVVRFDAKLEIGIFAIFLVTAVLPLLARRSAKPARSGAELLALAAMFAGLYLVLPYAHGGISDVDNRALPLAFLFLLLAGVGDSDLSPRVQAWQIRLAALIVCVNFLYLSLEVVPQNHAMELYKDIARHAPAASLVLPVNTRPKIGRYESFTHAGSFVTSESTAVIPYLFTASGSANFAYFRSRHDHYAPSVFWYTRNDGAVDWQTIKRTYDYLLVTHPYDSSRIPLAADVVDDNEVASLLKILK